MSLLPVEKTKKITALEKQTILLYGRAKIGKSTLASQFPDPVFLATEAGLNHLEVHAVNCNSWVRFREACLELSKGEHKFKTVIIDTLDNLVVYCSDYICKENGINYPGDLPHGRGWSLVTGELRRVLMKLASLSTGLVMVSHCALQEIETKTKKYSRWTISVSGKNKNIFLDMSDMILFIDSAIGKDGEEVRIIRTKPSMNYEAGDRTGLLPDVLKLDYNELAKYFSKGESK